MTDERWEYEPTFDSISSYDGQDVIVQSLQPYDTERLMIWPVGESYEKGFMIKVGDPKLKNTDRKKENPKWTLYRRVDKWVKIRSQKHKPKELAEFDTSSSSIGQINEKLSEQALGETLRRIRDHGRELGVGWCIQIANLALGGENNDA